MKAFGAWADIAGSSGSVCDQSHPMRVGIFHKSPYLQWRGSCAGQAAGDSHPPWKAWGERGVHLAVCYAGEFSLPTGAGARPPGKAASPRDSTVPGYELEAGADTLGYPYASWR